MLFSLIFPMLMPCVVLAEEVAKKTYSQYSMEELKDMTLLERAKLQNWRFEYITIGFTLASVVLFKFGDYYNEKLVSTFLEGLSDVFQKNFYQYGVSNDSLYVKDNSESYSSYASGRINVQQVYLTFRLKPRHNVFIWIMELVLSFFSETVVPPTDKVDIVIIPSLDAKYDNFIAAIVSKLGMNELRKYNYFLSLTKTADSAHIPESFVFMSEANEFQEKAFSHKLRNCLSSDTSSFLKFIAFTDQPVERPERIRECEPARKIMVSFYLSTKQDQMAQISQILDNLLSTVDDLASEKITFKNEALKKVVKTRENEIGKIQKVMDEIRQEQEASEKAKLIREEKKRLRNLSPEEQMKLEKKEMEKRQRKAQRKQRFRM